LQEPAIPVIQIAKFYSEDTSSRTNQTSDTSLQRYM